MLTLCTENKQFCASFTTAMLTVGIKTKLKYDNKEYLFKN